ncbi:MAG: NAD(P)H-hydrate epimerase [Planctomycetes bacterium]|nr:NAD(P)H-hydrate epimerase [Planctomycetota bacterium]
MLKTITSEQMSMIDANTEKLGIPRLVLMENAGAAVARYVIQNTTAKSVCVIAGPGNNGGDAFVAARHLSLHGIFVCLVFAGAPEKIRTPEASANWQIIKNLRNNLEISVITDVQSVNDLDDIIRKSDVIVDGMFGTGLKGDLREPYLSIVKRINDSGRQVIAVDAPTGVNPTTGEVHGTAVKAHVTVTFHKMKTGLSKAGKFCGKITVENIGIPYEAEIGI